MIRLLLFLFSLWVECVIRIFRDSLFIYICDCGHTHLTQRGSKKKEENNLVFMHVCGCIHTQTHIVTTSFRGKKGLKKWIRIKKNRTQIKIKTLLVSWKGPQHPKHVEMVKP